MVVSHACARIIIPFIVPGLLNPYLTPEACVHTVAVQMEDKQAVCDHLCSPLLDIFWLPMLNQARFAMAFPKFCILTDKHA